MTKQQEIFVEVYVDTLRAEHAAEVAGYGRPRYQAAKLLKDLSREIRVEMALRTMDGDEASKRMSDLARASIWPFCRIDDITGDIRIDLTTPEAQRHYHTIKEVKTNAFGQVEEIKLHDSKDALDKILRLHGKYVDHIRFEDITPEPWDPKKGDAKEYVRKQLNR